MKYPISPWAVGDFGELKLPSPNLHAIAHFKELTEIAMGGPMSGSLSVNGMPVEGQFSPSCIWSPDSQYLALPKWIVGGEHHRHQEFSIYSLSERKLYLADGRYSVLQLESFTETIVQGLQSPAYKPRPFEFDISKLCEPI